MTPNKPRSERPKSRIAVLVLAHRPASLACLATLLPPPFEVFVHFDARAGAPPSVSATNLHFIEPRRAIYWGGFAMVEATLDLLRAALRSGAYERYVLVSGDTLPVQKPEALAAALLDPRVEFMDMVEIPNDPSTRGKNYAEITAQYGSEHVGRFQNFQYWDSILTNPFTEADLAAVPGIAPEAVGAMRRAGAAIVAALLPRLPPRPKLFERFFFGSQWWGLSAELVMRIAPEIFGSAASEFFRFMEVPDEHYFHCIVGNRRPALETAGRCFLGSPVFTDHAARARGIHTVSMAMLRQAAANHAMFMRKFDPSSAPDVAVAIESGRYYEEVLGFA